MIKFVTTTEGFFECQSILPDGKVCRHYEKYSALTEMAVMRLAWNDGWTNRLGVARCKMCGRWGYPYGKATGKDGAS